MPNSESLNQERDSFEVNRPSFKYDEVPFESEDYDKCKEIAQLYKVPDYFLDLNDQPMKSVPGPDHMREKEAKRGSTNKRSSVLTSSKRVTFTWLDSLFNPSPFYKPETSPYYTDFQHVKLQESLYNDQKKFYAPDTGGDKARHGDSSKLNGLCRYPPQVTPIIGNNQEGYSKEDISSVQDYMERGDPNSSKFDKNEMEKIFTFQGSGPHPYLIDIQVLLYFLGNPRPLNETDKRKKKEVKILSSDTTTYEIKKVSLEKIASLICYYKWIFFQRFKLSAHKEALLVNQGRDEGILVAKLDSSSGSDPRQGVYPFTRMGKSKTKRSKRKKSSSDSDNENIRLLRIERLLKEALEVLETDNKRKSRAMTMGGKVKKRKRVGKTRKKRINSK